MLSLCSTDSPSVGSKQLLLCRHILHTDAVGINFMQRLATEKFLMIQVNCVTKEEVGRQHQGMDRPGVCQVPEGSGEQGKMEETGCEIICGTPTTLAVKGKDARENCKSVGALND